MNHLIEQVIDAKAQEVLEDHKKCLMNNIKHGMEAGLSGEELAEVAFRVGFLHGVVEIMKSDDDETDED